MRRSIFVLAVLALVAAACAPEETTPTTPTGETGAQTTAAACATDHEGDLFAPIAPSVLTIGTDNPVFQPWFAGTGKYQDWKANPDFGVGNPASGEGYESAAAYAIADRLGFTADQVDWAALNFNESYRPGPKDFDFYIGQVSYTPERAEQVTFSDGYYDVSQALIAHKGTPLAGATTLAELKPYTLGAQVGTTSFSVIDEMVQPDQDIRVYDRSVDVIQAFNNGQIDGYVVDAPTGYVNVLIGEAKKALVVGQFPAQGEYFGLVLEQGNPYVECLNLAIAELKQDGTLDALNEEWLANVSYPVFA